MKKGVRLLIILSMLWALIVLALGVWWAYLIRYLLSVMEEHHIHLSSNIGHMIRWETPAFVILLILLSLTLVLVYYRDMKKAKGLQSFFGTITHELKTPLASVHLQAEVIDDLVQIGRTDKLNEVSKRLIEDTHYLETQFDKILQLARVEVGGNLKLNECDLLSITKNILAKLKKRMRLEEKDIPISNEDGENEYLVAVDPFALELIFRNLLENSKKYSKTNKPKISIYKDHGFIFLDYSDGGEFQGKEKYVGKLFFKHQTESGAGIGLYLVKKFMQIMNGELVVQTTPQVHFILKFPKGARAI